MNDDCWLYARFTDKEDYGRMSWRLLDGSRASGIAHRVLYEIWVGEIPKGLQLDHLCNTPRCINPKHLNPTTGRNNVLRSEQSRAGANIRKQYCVNGHHFDESNTYIRPSPEGKIWRTCRECAKLNERKRRGLRKNS